MNHQEIKWQFIKQLESETKFSHDWDTNIINTLPNCYAKGWLMAMSKRLSASFGDYKEDKAVLLKWAEYDIWI